MPKEEEEEATDWLESCRRMDTTTGSTSVPPGWTLGPGSIGASKLTLLGEDATDIEDMLLCLESDRWKGFTFSSKSGSCGMSRNCWERCDAERKLTDLVDFLESVLIIKFGYFHGAFGGSISKPGLSTPGEVLGSASSVDSLPPRLDSRRRSLDPALRPALRGSSRRGILNLLFLVSWESSMIM